MLPENLRRLLCSRGHAWLLAWALCLPVAQWASAAHALLHLQSAVAGEQRDAPEQLPASCDTCVVAASLGGAAPVPLAGFATAVALPHALAASFASAPARAVAYSAFLSRAPPSLNA